MFASTSKTHVMEMKLQLQITGKCNLIVDDYFDRVKGFFNKRSAIGHPIQESDMIVHLLDGLGDEYNFYVCALNSRVDSLPIEEKNRLNWHFDGREMALYKQILQA